MRWALLCLALVGCAETDQKALDRATAECKDRGGVASFSAARSIFVHCKDGTQIIWTPR